MSPFLIALVIVILCFGFVLLFGAPYLPTMQKQIDLAFKLAALKPGQTVIELGSGDGRVAIEAAKLGATVIGYELNPLLVIYSKIKCFKYRNKIKIRWANFWKTQWPEADIIFTFLLPKYMSKLDQKITDYPHRPVILVSYAFNVPGKKAVREDQGVFLYKYK